MDLLAASVRIATPLALAAIGGLLSERAGVFAVGLEGMMLAGAFGATLGTGWTGNVALGVLAGGCGGVLVAAAVALVAIRGRADQMVTGLTANILAVGATSYGLRIAGEGLPALRPLADWRLPVLSGLPMVGRLFVQPPLTWLAIACVAWVGLVLRRTRPGLMLRAAGENIEAVRAAGGRPRAIRTRAVLACGFLAGLGGAVLPLQQVGGFTDDMTGGRGYLALASLIVGRWTAWGASLACLGFGLAEALELQLEAAGIAGNSYLMQMIPYLSALGVLAVMGRGARFPAAIGRSVGGA